MIENPPPKLPLKTHGYLRSVVYDIANEMDRQKEVKRNKKERDRSRRSEVGGQEKAEPERITAEEMKAIRKKNYRKGKL